MQMILSACKSTAARVATVQMSQLSTSPVSSRQAVQCGDSGSFRSDCFLAAYMLQPNRQLTRYELYDAVQTGTAPDAEYPRLLSSTIYPASSCRFTEATSIDRTCYQR